MAAAVTLADAGIAPAVYEAAPDLGGRARRVVVNGVALDNGLHILIGAHRETLRLISAVHPDADAALARSTLDWNINRRFRLRAPRLPPPLHLVGGVLGARGASWTERIRAVRFVRAMREIEFRLPQDMSVDALLAANGQSGAFAQYFWRPLCLAALNTPPAIASAQIYLNVLRDGLAGARDAADIFIARSDLTALFPAPAADYVRARRGRVSTACGVTSLAASERGFEVCTRSDSERFDHVICAVSPHRLERLLSPLPQLGGVLSCVRRFRYQPIYSVYLQLEGRVRLPAPMLGLTGMAHWLFDREAICGQRGLVAAVMSGEGAHENMPQDALARTIYDEITAELGPSPPLLWHRVIAEKRATIECSAGLERPSVATPLAKLHLAGDYTQSDYPATLEAAVRSGIAAAQRVIAHVRTDASMSLAADVERRTV
jgi:squalene-associated FAD-dependent desaturase